MICFDLNRRPDCFCAEHLNRAARALDGSEPQCDACGDSPARISSVLVPRRPWLAFDAAPRALHWRVLHAWLCYECATETPWLLKDLLDTGAAKRLQPVALDLPEISGTPRIVR